MKKGNKTFKELLLELELEQGRSCWIFRLMGKFSPNIAMIMINPTPPFSQLVCRLTLPGVLVEQQSSSHPQPEDLKQLPNL